MINHIHKAICNDYKVTVEDLKGLSRKRKYTEPRQLSHYFLKLETTLTLQEIGDTSNRHYSTVLHSLKSINNLYETNKRFRERVNKIGSVLGIQPRLLSDFELNETVVEINNDQEFKQALVRIIELRSRGKYIKGEEKRILKALNKSVEKYEEKTLINV
jgi:hypothetical protein